MGCGKGCVQFREGREEEEEEEAMETTDDLELSSTTFNACGKKIKQ